MLDFRLWTTPRIRLVRQHEATECGLACLAMIASFHGLDVALSTLRREFAPSLRGTTVKTLMEVADQLSLTSRAVKLECDTLARLSAPAILHWNLNHYVVMENIRGGKVLIHNPEGYSKWLLLSEISNHFTGVAIELRPSPTFKKVRRRKNIKFGQLLHNINGLGSSIIQLILLSLLLEAFILVSPYFMQISIDDVLPAMDFSLLEVLAIGFGLFAIINAVSGFLRSFILLSVGTNIGYGISINIARHLFNLPVDWFEKRNVGDILSRFQSVTPIQNLLSQGAAAAIVDGALAAFTLILMFIYSVKLTFIALGAFTLYGASRLISFYIQRSAQERSIVAAAREQTVMIDSLRGITTLRLFNSESQRHAFWQSRLTDSVNAQIHASRVSIWQTMTNSLIFGIENVITIWLAISFVLNGGFSLGMIFAYLSLKSQFTNKASNLIDQCITFNMIGLHLERIADIAFSETDRSVDVKSLDHRPFNGGITLRDIKYRYSKSDAWILEGINLSVAPGAYIAITGPSGSGKSTLIKVLLGLLEPESGEILVDDIPINRFGFRNFRDQIGAVLQEDSLFAGTLIENIAVFDDRPDIERVIRAARDAEIHEDIMQMHMQYGTLTGDMGSALSGGQKQRVLLARALYRQPRMLVMDEGTAHLDDNTENKINETISKLGITRIVVAHRRSTIMKACEVYVQTLGSDLLKIYPTQKHKQ